jgi:hypothetical protein
MFGLKALSDPKPQPLEDKLEDAHQRVADLRAAIEAVNDNDPKALHGLPEALRDAECSIPYIEREIEQRDALELWRSERANADATIKAAKKETDAAAKALAALDADHAKAAGKLAKLKLEAEGGVERAQQDEQRAAEAYAETMAKGNEAEESAALENLNRASETLEAAQRYANRQAAVITALSAQVGAIEQKQAAEHARLQENRTRRFQALRHKLGAQWDMEAKKMAELGAQLVALDYAICGSSRALDSLEIPLTSKESAGRINGRGLRDASEAVDVEGIRA